MLTTVCGDIQRCKFMGHWAAQLQLNGFSHVIELSVHDALVLGVGERLRIAGQMDSATGKFKGYAYLNESRGVRGRARSNIAGGLMFVAAGILFFWAIFPLFIHLPMGIKAIRHAVVVRRAASMVNVPALISESNVAG